MLNQGEDVLSKPLRRKAGSGDRVTSTNNGSMMDYVPQQPKVNHLMAAASKTGGSGSFMHTSKSNIGAGVHKHSLNKGSKNNLNDLGIMLNNVKPSGVTKLGDGVIVRQLKDLSSNPRSHEGSNKPITRVGDQTTQIRK